MTTAEQIINGSTVRPKRFRVDEFHKMTEAGILPEESGWEIIDGFLIDKMTIGSKHLSIVNRLTRIFVGLVGDRAIVSVQNPVHIDDFNEPEPDIAILKPRPDDYAYDLPTASDAFLLIEISDSNIRYDRDIKMTLYAEAGIAEVWLVNLLEDTVERYSSPMNGRFGSVETISKGDSVQSISMEYVSLDVDEIFGVQ